MHIRANTKSDDAFICIYWDVVGRGAVTDQQISFVVKYADRMLRYQDRDMAIKWMDTHSLQLGRVCVLKLTGYDAIQIRKMGRWAPRSNAFLEYIQTQLSTLSAGMATNISKVTTFANIEGASNIEDLYGLIVH